MHLFLKMICLVTFLSMTVLSPYLLAGKTWPPNTTEEKEVSEKEVKEVYMAKEISKVISFTEFNHVSFPHYINLRAQDEANDFQKPPPV